MRQLYTSNSTKFPAFDSNLWSFLRIEIQYKVGRPLSEHLWKGKTLLWIDLGEQLRRDEYL